MEWQARIVTDPAVLLGKPMLRGTILSVEFLLDLLSGGWTYEQIRNNYPAVTGDDLLACIAYEREVLQQKRPWPPART